MTIIIPYIHSTWGGLELKYSLRAIEKYAIGVDDIVIIGDKPDWLTNVNHIEFKDLANIENKEKNIKNKIMVAFEQLGHDEVGFFNDDHFLLQKTEIEKYPYYRGGYLVYNKGTNGAYRKSVNNTIDALKSMGKDTWNFDVHCPILYQKDKFIEAMNSVDWRKPNGYVIKSLYCNYWGIEGMPHIDLKIHSQVPYHRLRKMVEGQDVFSIGDRAIGIPMKKLFELYFPKRSIYEKNI